MTTPVSSIFAAPAAATTPAATASTGTGADASNGASASSGNSLLDPQAFLQLLVAQLQYQDPTNPTDTSTFMNQTAMLSQVQTMTGMSDTLTSLVNAEQAQAATNLVGRTITYVDPQGIQQTGVVSSASLLETGATLTVGADKNIPLANVVGVNAPASASS